MGSTDISLHKASDGTSDLSTTPTESQTVNVTAADTVVTATFSSANFSANDIIGISVDPTNVHGNVDLTIVIEINFSS